MKQRPGFPRPIAGAAAAVPYLASVARLLPETKGRTLKEIEAHFKRA